MVVASKGQSENKTGQQRKYGNDYENMMKEKKEVEKRSPKGWTDQEFGVQPSHLTRPFQQYRLVQSKPRVRGEFHTG
jgi:hypothetical protein